MLGPMQHSINHFAKAADTPSVRLYFVLFAPETHWEKITSISRNPVYLSKLNRNNESYHLKTHRYNVSKKLKECLILLYIIYIVEFWWRLLFDWSFHDEVFIKCYHIRFFPVWDLPQKVVDFRLRFSLVVKFVHLFYHEVKSFKRSWINWLMLPASHQFRPVRINIK